MSDLQRTYFVVILVAISVISCNKEKVAVSSSGALIRGDTTVKNIALVFTGNEFGDG